MRMCKSCLKYADFSHLLTSLFSNSIIPLNPFIFKTCFYALDCYSVALSKKAQSHIIPLNWFIIRKYNIDKVCVS